MRIKAVPLIMAVLLSGFLCLSSGCAKKKLNEKNKRVSLVSQDLLQMLEGIAIPFDSVVEQDVTSDTAETVIFKIKTPPKKIDFLEEFFCNTMQQAGWLLQKKFLSQDAVIIDFCSLSRSCLIIIHRDAKKDLFSKKTTMYIHFFALKE